MLSATLALLVAGLSPGPTDPAEKSKPVNILVFIADDVSPDDLGCYGHPKVRTPNLDRLARDGLRFDSAFLTCSSCSPSRCSILTGRYPHSTGAPELHMPLPREQGTIGKWLKEAGYYTAVAGKWHLGEPARQHFDRLVAGAPSGCENWLKVLRERPRDKPFFLWLASIDAHRPYPGNAVARPHPVDDVVVPPFLPDVPEVRKDLALYYDEIARLDGHVGTVLAELDKQGAADNTLVLFLADNGRPFPRCKTTLYDSGIRTPLLARWPGHVRPGGVCKSLVSSVDLAPTLAEIAGLKRQPTCQGRSLAGLLTDPKGSVRDWVVAEHNWHDYQAHERAVRTRRHLYLRNAFPNLPGTPPADAVRSDTYQAMLALEEKGKLKPAERGCLVSPRPAEELYDIVADPHCLNNLAGKAEHRTTQAELAAVLEKWIKETDDKVTEKPTPDRFDRKTGKPLK